MTLEPGVIQNVVSSVSSAAVVWVLNRLSAAQKRITDLEQGLAVATALFDDKKQLLADVVSKLTTIHEKLAVLPKIEEVLGSLEDRLKTFVPRDEIEARFAYLGELAKAHNGHR